MSVLLEVAGLRLPCWIQSKYCCLRRSCFHTCRGSTDQRKLLPLNLRDLDVTSSSRSELYQQRNASLSHSITEYLAATYFDKNANVPCALCRPLNLCHQKKPLSHINWSNFSYQIFQTQIFSSDLSFEWTCHAFATWTCSMSNLQLSSVFNGVLILILK